jgi:quercetin dioxygenase-like cupin family protein
MEMFAPPGKSTPMHRHAREDETLVVLEGVVDVTIDGEPVQVRAGQNARLPRQSAHRIANNGAGPARYLLVCAPAGFEAFIEHVAEAQAGPVVPTPPGPEQIARMRASSEQFGITLLPG